VTQDDLLYRFIYGCSRSPQSWGMCGWHVGPWTSTPRPITAGGASWTATAPRSCALGSGGCRGWTLGGGQRPRPSSLTTIPTRRCPIGHPAQPAPGDLPTKCSWSNRTVFDLPDDHEPMGVIAIGQAGPGGSTGSA